MSPIYVPGKVVLRKGWQPMDPDAAAYITAVEAADTTAGQSGGLEERTKIAIDNFVLGCKADGIWTAIKASCILAGARTLEGALVPLVGTAPTNAGPFVAGDYNRKTGLVGDGSTKYLNSNRNNNADPQNSQHLACSVTTQGTASLGMFIGGGNSYLYRNNALSILLGLSRMSSPEFNGGGNSSVDNNFIGITRSSGASYSYRTKGANTNVTAASIAPASADINVFRYSNATLYTNARLAFYSIGESLDLALLDARVTTLINAFAAAIP
jgi:hypothetical protein